MCTKWTVYIQDIMVSATRYRHTRVHYQMRQLRPSYSLAWLYYSDCNSYPWLVFHVTRQTSCTYNKVQLWLYLYYLSDSYFQGSLFDCHGNFEAAKWWYAGILSQSKSAHPKAFLNINMECLSENHDHTIACCLAGGSSNFQIGLTVGH